MGNELRAAETRPFKIFFDVLPKDGLGGQSPANPSFGRTPSVDLLSAAFTDCIVKSVSFQKEPPAKPYFRMTTTKIVKNAFLWHSPQMSQGTCSLKTLPGIMIRTVLGKKTIIRI